MRRLGSAKRVSERDKQLMAELKDVVARQVPGASLILYGSAARGKRAPDSDYDVVILTGRRLSSAEERLLDRAIYDLQVERGVVLSAAVYSEEEWRRPLLRASPYWKNVAREGILV